MVGLCRILSTATLVVHLTVICCTPYVQGCQGKDCPFRAPAAPSSHSTECECERSQHTLSHQGGKRSSVSTRRVDGTSHFPPFQGFFLALPNDQPNQLNMGFQQRIQDAESVLPIRIHLANQVLLI